MKACSTGTIIESTETSEQRENTLNSQGRRGWSRTEGLRMVDWTEVEVEEDHPDASK